MSKTNELIQRIIDMIDNKSIGADSIPVRDIKDCVFAEIDLYESTYTKEQYADVIRVFNDLCCCIKENEQDIEKIRMFLEGALLCLNTVSEAVLSLADRNYWEKWHRDELGQSEVEEIIDYVDRKKDIRLLNYDFVDKYMCNPVELCYDSEQDMKYVPYKGLRMYFPSGWGDQRICDYYNSLLAEQDDYSPHCYKKNGFTVSRGDVILDIGAAEGIFAIDHLNEAKFIYLIESDEKWVKALKQTFRDHEDKVKIIYGKVCKRKEEDIDVVLDDLFHGMEINYIKMDIEGYEREALEGAKELLIVSEHLTCAICSYHEQIAQEWITAFLQERGFVTDHSRGYICPDWCIEGRIEAQLRRGIVFGKKDIT